jgi:hypothetical protein
MKLSTFYKIAENNDLEVLQLLLKTYPDCINEYSFFDESVETCLKNHSMECLNYLLDLLDKINQGIYVLCKKLPFDIIKQIKEYSECTVFFDQIQGDIIEDNEDLLLKLIKYYETNISDITIIDNGNYFNFDEYMTRCEDYYSGNCPAKHIGTKVLRFYLNKHKNDEYRSITDYTLMEHFCDNNFTDLLKIFIEFHNKYRENNILYEAVSIPELKYVKLLLDNGADPQKPIIDDGKKYTLLEYTQKIYEEYKDYKPSHNCFDPEIDKIVELVNTDN